MKPPEKPTSTALVPVKVTEVELLRPHERPRKPLGERVIEAWMKNRKPTTLRAYQSDLEDFRKFLQVETKAEAVEILLENKGRAHTLCMDYVEHMQKRGLKPATVVRKIQGGLTAIVNMARAIDEDGKIDWRLEPVLPSVQTYKDTKGPGADVIAQIEDYFSKTLARARDPAAKMLLSRNYTIFRLMATRGLRRGEVVSLDTDHVDLHKREIKIWGKGRDEREALKLPLQTMGILQQWVDLRSKDPKLTKTQALFVALNDNNYGHRLTGDAIYDIVKGIEKTLGLKTPLRPHGLRHGSVTLAASKMEHFPDVVSFARHRKADTTLRYIDNLAERAAVTAQAVEDAIGEDLVKLREMQKAKPVDPEVRKPSAPNKKEPL